MSEIYELQIHFWPNAALAGHVPKAKPDATQAELDRDKALYVPWSVFFDRRPTREDFTAWAVKFPGLVHDPKVLEAINNSAWPLLRSGQQIDEVTLVRKDLEESMRLRGPRVGRLILIQQPLIQARGYEIELLKDAEIQQILERFIPSVRNAAWQELMKASNLLYERLLHQAPRERINQAVEYLTHRQFQRRRTHK